MGDHFTTKKTCVECWDAAGRSAGTVFVRICSERLKQMKEWKKEAFDSADSGHP
jgi:hypothetical protein